MRSKQFLRLLRDENGARQSMVQRVYSQIKKTVADPVITIAANSAQTDAITTQLPGDVEIVCEPDRRDTYPAILLSCAYLAYEKKIDPGEPVVVMPIDPYADDVFFKMIDGLGALLGGETDIDIDIALIGVKPTIPTSKYGYIVPGGGETGDNVYNVSYFVEKPDERTAGELIKNGALWNSGVFAFRLSYIIDLIENTHHIDTYEDLLLNYQNIEKISFDYKVVENAERMAVMRYDGEWSDIGTWRTLTDKIDYSTYGSVLNESSKNTFVINELNIPIITLGTSDIIVAASPDGILVSDLVESSFLKPAVDKIKNDRPMYEDRAWGNYSVLEYTNDDLIKKITVGAGKRTDRQRHLDHDEISVVISGAGTFILDDEEKPISPGDVLDVRRGRYHSIAAADDLKIVEIQLNGRFDEGDA